MKFLISISCALVIISSCSKSADNNIPTSPGFSWQYNGILYHANFDTVIINPSTPNMIPLIIAGTGTGINAIGSGVEIEIQSLTPGAYAYPSILSAKFYYINSSGAYSSIVSGTVNITQNANNLLSGNFSVTMMPASGPNFPLTGNFTDVPIGH